jgi:hypothetical protein
MPFYYRLLSESNGSFSGETLFTGIFHKQKYILACPACPEPDEGSKFILSVAERVEGFVYAAEARS